MDHNGPVLQSWALPLLSLTGISAQPVHHEIIETNQTIYSQQTLLDAIKHAYVSIFLQLCPVLLRKPRSCWSIASLLNFLITSIRGITGTKGSSIKIINVCTQRKATTVCNIKRLWQSNVFMVKWVVQIKMKHSLHEQINAE
jgi:hypothetical protein